LTLVQLDVACLDLPLYGQEEEEVFGHSQPSLEEDQFPASDGQEDVGFTSD
jgi:hypothetical protein